MTANKTGAYLPVGFRGKAPFAFWCFMHTSRYTPSSQQLKANYDSKHPALSTFNERSGMKLWKMHAKCGSVIFLFFHVQNGSNGWTDTKTLYFSSLSHAQFASQTSLFSTTPFIISWQFIFCLYIQKSTTFLFTYHYNT